MSLSEQSLSERLRALRGQYRGARVTQQNVASALGVSPALVSSWESGGAVPSAERLRDYALAFASERTFAQADPELPDESDLTPAEDRRRQDLTDELGRLRDVAMRPDDAPESGRGALGGRFWYFPDGAPVRVITTPIWPSLAAVNPYADPRHPNYIQAFRDMDADATIELVSHIRAENPATDVRFLTADKATRDDLIKHVVVLGQNGNMLRSDRPPPEGSEHQPSIMDYLVPRLEIPVATQMPDGGNNEWDTEFIVTLDERGDPTYYSAGETPARVEAHRPRFLRTGRERETEDGMPLLEYDVALLARQPNQLNRSMSVTLCTGTFSRGTFGAVRALTDPTLRARNEEFLLKHFGTLDHFWMLFYVPVFRAMAGLETVTPDLERPFHRLRDSVGRGDDEGAVTVDVG